MKLGPVHVIRDRTFHRLHQKLELWSQFRECLVQAEIRGNLLANSVLARSTGLYHSPLCARTAPIWIPETDAIDDRSRIATERVIAAYQRALADDVERPSPGMWQEIEQQKADFLQAAQTGDVLKVQTQLVRLFRTSIPWGLGQICASHLEVFEKYPNGNFVQLGLVDNVVSLAEALAIQRLTILYQNPAAHLSPLDVDLDLITDQIVSELGFDIAFPKVAGAFGMRVADRLVTIDSYVHPYTVHRLKQLDVSADARIVEIGGGYGCLALMMHRGGYRNYTVYDLPFVNLLQGYFLIMAGVDVCLYGEDRAGVRLMPYWKFDEIPTKSVDCVINTDSLPEMGQSTARGYLSKIHRVLNGLFLSINQEAKAPNAEFGEQQCVAELVRECGLFRTASRQRYWLRMGYAEEVYIPRN